MKLLFVFELSDATAWPRKHEFGRSQDIRISPIGFSRPVFVDHQVAICRRFCTPFSTNVQHRLEQVSGNDADIYEQGQIQPVRLWGAIAVIFGSQVSIRVHYCKRDEVYATRQL